MDPSNVINSQFERAVGIVQSLPKTGPIQTGYEEKLAMYSLYKQATVGNVKTPRPGLWDMLGRAKWDAWEKHKDVAPHEAKWLYVETLLKVLRKYSDKTAARDLVRELESYGDMGGSFAHLSHRDGRSSASGSSGSASAAAASRNPHRDPNAAYLTSEEEVTDDDTADTAEGGETSEDDRDEPGPLPGVPSQGDPSFRSPSSLSSQMRYRTPMAGSTFTPPPIPAVPATQPLPGFSTPSAFGGTLSPTGIPSSASASTFPAPVSYPPSSTTYPPHLAHSSAGPSRRSPLPPSQSLNAIPQRHPLQPTGVLFPDPRPPLERAVESIQAHIAALTERVEILESLVGRRPHPSLSSSSLLASSNSFMGLGIPGRPWDPTQMGLWSLVMAPLARIAHSLRTLAQFLAYPPAEDDAARDPRHRLYPRGKRLPASSPVLLVVRRLFLDATFVLAVLGLVRWTWHKTGLRRREVYVALGVLWRALVGSEAAPRKGRKMIDRGV